MSIDYHLPIAKVGDNMFIANNTGFGVYRSEIVFDILRSIDINFSGWLGMPPFSSKPCVIDWRDGYPECVDLGSYHLIYLSARYDYWCQWAYQFAHEYCHHLIDGGLSGEVAGLVWFEETVCELSSMSHLHRLYSDWSLSKDPVKNPWAHYFRDYLHDLVSESPGALSLGEAGWLCRLSPVLSDGEYHRDIYRSIALRMSRFFQAEPRLWRIISHFGNMRKRDSLRGLFSDLRGHVSRDYRKSFSALERFLLA